ncbi:MAG: DUF4404 family protein [Deltaproteobacteria bacterium]|jgi:hypothetical protein|nr:DUF4404 family protein [Deltaproteobacteria bacterium]
MSETADDRLAAALAALDEALEDPARLSEASRAQLAGTLLRIEAALSAAAEPRHPDEAAAVTARFAVEHPALHDALQRLGAMLTGSGI